MKYQACVSKTEDLIWRGWPLGRQNDRVKEYMSEQGATRGREGLHEHRIKELG